MQANSQAPINGRDESDNGDDPEIRTDGGTSDDEQDDDRFDRTATIEAIRLSVGRGDVGYVFSTGEAIKRAVGISGWSRPVVELVEERAPLPQFDHLPETPRRLADRDPDETYRVTVATVHIDTSLDPDNPASFEIYFEDGVELVETDDDEPEIRTDGGTTPAVKTWFCETIEKVRIASTPGGDALTLVEARAFRDALTDAIDRAEMAHENGGDIR